MRHWSSTVGFHAWDLSVWLLVGQAAIQKLSAHPYLEARHQYSGLSILVRISQGDVN
jgi:hypothetical protein